MKLFILCSVWFLLAALSPAQQKDSSATDSTLAKKTSFDADGRIRHSKTKGYDEAYMPMLFPSSHAANLLRLRNGDVLCAWFSGSQEGESDVAIVVSRLPHGSKQWSKPIIVDHQPGKSYQNPVPFQAPDGRLWIFHTEQDAGAGQANAHVLYVTSKDNGKTWTAPKVLFDKPGAFTRQPLVVVSKYKWILPMYYTPSRGITKGADSNYSVIEMTSDAGEMWKECEIPESDGLVQPSVVDENSHYVAFFRSRYADFVYRSTSEDGCKWTAPVASALPNNNASIQVAKLKDGDLVIAFNNVNASDKKGKPQTAPRVPLSVALSKDEGKSWSFVRDVETQYPDFAKQFSGLSDKPGREEYSYPSVMQMPNGQIGVAYTYRRRTIKFVEFDESWIQQGSTTGKFKGN